jgi:hypothetical protein
MTTTTQNRDENLALDLHRDYKIMKKRPARRIIASWKSFTQLMVFLSITCLTIQDVYAADLTAGGEVAFTGAAQDFTVPADADELEFEVIGADGGTALVTLQSTCGSGVCAASGGLGAAVYAKFVVGTADSTQIPPGSTIRFVVGGKGESNSKSVCLGGDVTSGGGGASAVLLKRPSSSAWEELVAAGGGGGAHSGFALGCAERSTGYGGQASNTGHDGDGDAGVGYGDGGSGGQGGCPSGGAPGGGAKSDGKTESCGTWGSSAYLSEVGKKGQYSGGAGGNGTSYAKGGFGYGGGGAAAIDTGGGGGGGGWSGGGGGGQFRGGGGGGSYVSKAGFSPTTDLAVNQALAVEAEWRAGTTFSNASNVNHIAEAGIIAYAVTSNSDPVIAANSATVTAGEGNAATNAGTVTDADGDTVVLTASVGSVTNNGDGTWSWSFSTTDGPDNTATVTISGSDGNGGTASASFQLTVNNVAPTVTLSAGNTLSVDESGTTQHTYSYTISDPGTDTVTGVTTSCGTGGNKVAASDTNNDSSGSFKCIFPDGPASPVVSASATDSDSATGTADTQTVTVSNVAPTVAASPLSQSVQYSDGIAEVTITGTDVTGDPLSASTTWNVDGGSFTSGLPSTLKLVKSGCTGTPSHTCTWKLSGIANVSAGSYIVHVTIADGDGGTTSKDIGITVQPEDASVEFDSDNSVAVQVAEDGGDSGVFTLAIFVTETLSDLPDDGSEAPGDISLAVVTMELVPVAQGGPISGVCTPEVIGTSGYDQGLLVICGFDEVPVNTYSVETTVNVDGYYTGFGEDVLTVYDPSLGFTSGGGWFYWPGTCSGYPGECDGEYPGDKTNIGYTMKYNKKATKVQGSLLMISHLPDGSKYRVKSNALHGLALGEDDTYGWASFSGKSTFLEPGMPEPEGNHYFVVYVEDFGEQGCDQNPTDWFWITVDDKDGMDVLSMGADAETDGVNLHCGNIIVPHGSGGNGGGKKGGKKGN